MTPRKLTLAATVLSFALLAACDDGGEQGLPGTDPPTNQAPSSTSTGPATPPPGSDGENIGKAPPLPKPLDTARFEKSPCELLTKEQLGEFGGATGRPGTVAGSDTPECVWELGANNTVRIAAWFQPGPTRSGLGDVYAQNEQGLWSEGYFEPIKVGDYPAAFASIDDGRDDGFCRIALGARNDVYISLEVDAGAQGRKSCTAAENVASKVLETLTSGGN